MRNPKMIGILLALLVMIGFALGYLSGKDNCVKRYQYRIEQLEQELIKK